MTTLSLDVDLYEILYELRRFLSEDEPFIFEVGGWEYELSMKKLGTRCIKCGEYMTPVNTPHGLAYACIECHPEYADKVIE